MAVALGQLKHSCRRLALELWVGTASVGLMVSAVLFPTLP